MKRKYELCHGNNKLKRVCEIGNIELNYKDNVQNFRILDVQKYIGRYKMRNYQREVLAELISKEQYKIKARRQGTTYALLFLSLALISQDAFIKIHVRKPEELVVLVERLMSIVNTIPKLSREVDTYWSASGMFSRQCIFNRHWNTGIIVENHFLDDEDIHLYIERFQFLVGRKFYQVLQKHPDKTDVCFEFSE